MSLDPHPHQAEPPAPNATDITTVTGQATHETISVTHSEFCRGLPAGQFNLIVDPVKARKYIRQRLFLLPLMLPVVGIGAALAISGHPWIGLALILGGGFVHRIVTHQAPKILLHLAIKDPRTYFEAIEYEILEVRLRQS